MTPLDFFLGFFKERVYKTKPANIAELKQRITDQINLITIDMLRKVRDSVELKLAHCQAVERRQFEHLI